MINNNASNIFRGNAMGLENPTLEEMQRQAYIQEQQQMAMEQDGFLRAIQPINFNDKIMGGANAERFMHGKLPEIGGSYAYTQKVNMLTGKGVNKMEEEMDAGNRIANMVASSDSAVDKINSMLGNGSSGSAVDKINNMLLGNKS